MYLYDNPSFVHTLCDFATDLEIQISNRLGQEAGCAFFMPDGFCELLSPEQYLEFAVPYTAKLINANKNSLFYTAVPKTDYRQIADLYKAVKGHKKLICMGSSIDQGNPLHNVDELEDLCGILTDLQRPFQLAIHQNLIKRGSEKDLDNHIEEMITTVKGGNFMIRTDVIDPKTPPRNIDTLMALVERHRIQE